MILGLSAFGNRLPCGDCSTHFLSLLKTTCSTPEQQMLVKSNLWPRLGLWEWTYWVRSVVHAKNHKTPRPKSECVPHVRTELNDGWLENLFWVLNMNALHLNLYVSFPFAFFMRDCGELALILHCSFFHVSVDGYFEPSETWNQRSPMRPCICFSGLDISCPPILPSVLYCPNGNICWAINGKPRTMCLPPWHVCVCAFLMNHKRFAPRPLTCCGSDCCGN